MPTTPQPSKSNTPQLQAALDYAARGWHVFPLQAPKPGAGCSCGKRDCKSVGKHPRTQHGLKDATTDESTIRAWWRKWPDANVGIATGADSMLVVLDVDPEKGGDESLADLEKAHGPLPGTVRGLTGGGGTHLYYQHPGSIHVKTSASELAPGLDIRGDGGYVVGPPSLHESGQRYVWDVGAHPDDLSAQPIPTWLLTRIQKPTSNEQRRAEPVLGRIPEKRRNTTLTSLSGSMRRRGMLSEEIYAALTAVNQRCDPRLSEAELWRIARSVGRYPTESPLTAIQRQAQHLARRLRGLR